MAKPMKAYSALFTTLTVLTGGQRETQLAAQRKTKNFHIAHFLNHLASPSNLTYKHGRKTNPQAHQYDYDVSPTAITTITSLGQTHALGLRPSHHSKPRRHILSAQPMQRNIGWQRLCLAFEFVPRLVAIGGR
jgi:hypothetical protein